MKAKFWICGALTAAVMCGAGLKTSVEPARGQRTVKLFKSEENPVFAGGLVRYSKGRWVMFKKIAPRPMDGPEDVNPLAVPSIEIEAGVGLLSLASTN